MKSKADRLKRKLDQETMNFRLFWYIGWCCVTLHIGHGCTPGLQAVCSMAFPGLIHTPCHRLIAEYHKTVLNPTLAQARRIVNPNLHRRWDKGGESSRVQIATGFFRWAGRPSVDRNRDQALESLPCPSWWKATPFSRWHGV